MKRRPPITTYLKVTEARLRTVLHEQLDQLLNGTVDDGKPTPVITSLAHRALLGFGFTVRVDTVQPSDIEAGQIPDTVERPEIPEH